MKIKKIKARSIITRSNLPDADFVINPYVGCMHGCLYCYARFMKRFTNHHEPWGKFLDIKINAPFLVPKDSQKYNDRTIVLSSVTDPYQPAERRYKLTRKILERLIPLQPSLCVLTKSDLITRDIDVLKQFRDCVAGISLSLMDDGIRKEVEPLASSAERRVNAVRELKKSGISTFIFISPMFPEFTDWKGLINKTNKFTDEFWFENLNVNAANWPNIKKWLKNKHPELLDVYGNIYFTDNNYWCDIEKEIKSFCRKNKIKSSIYFHHGRSK